MVRQPVRAAEHGERVAQCLQAPFAGPAATVPHGERGKGGRFTCPLRSELPRKSAPLAQSAGTQRKVTDERCGDPTLSVQTLYVPHVISAALEHAHPFRLHSGGSLRSQQGPRAVSRGRSEA